MSKPQTEPAGVNNPRIQRAFANLKAKAAAIGWTCLDSDWHGQHTEYQFVCAQGHRLSRIAYVFLKKSGSCAECKGQANLLFLKQWAQQHGGRCLEEVYLGREPHRFVCAKGHEWATRPATMRVGKTWCPHCNYQVQNESKIKRDGFLRIQQAALEKGGRCLSTEYSGVQTEYQFECARGHQWHTLGARILRGSWCLRCTQIDHGAKTRLKDGLERLQQIARDKGGVCLSEVYTRNSDKYQFRCVKGHEWQTEAGRVFNGNWCPQCVHDSLRLNIEDLKQMAIDRGGLCLSDEYVRNNVPMLWECHRGHQWKVPAASIRAGQWCHQCAVLVRCTDPKSKARLKYLVDKSSAGE